MTVHFRHATRDDVPAVLDLLRDDKLGATREDAPLKDYLAAFADMHAERGNTLIVGVLGARIVATYQLIFISGISLRASRRAQLEGVRVASDLRGRKIGSAMIADAEARARRAGCALMQLTMNESRMETAHFYTRLGFTPSHIGYKRELS